MGKIVPQPSPAPKSNWQKFKDKIGEDWEEAKRQRAEKIAGKTQAEINRADAPELLEILPIGRRGGMGRGPGAGKPQSRTPPSTQTPATPNKPPETPNKGNPSNTKPAKSNGGGTVLGSGKEDCGIKPYKNQKCPTGQQAHHIVPDYALRYGTRGDGGKRIPGMPSLEDGPSICVSGNARSPGSDHNAAHKGTDTRISDAGKKTTNGVEGNATMGEILDISIEEMSKVKPHCADEIKTKTVEAFKDVDRSKYGRTTQQPPKPGTNAHGALQRGDSHQSGGTRRIPGRKGG